VAAVVALALTAVMLLPNKAATAVLASTLASLALAPDTLVVGLEAVWITIISAAKQAQLLTAVAAETTAVRRLTQAVAAVVGVTAPTPEALAPKTEQQAS
tara:strand:+ start:577 stop:876 length:300 start_codon:yes stop_codon:yes gene_type:complete